MNKEQIIKEINKLNLELEQLEEAERLKDFKELTFKGKKYRIYKWEDKPIGDFLKTIPKGFRLIEHSEFIELFDNKIIDYPEKNWEVYFTKHYSKRKQKENILLRCLFRDSNLDFGIVDLLISNSYGRVVLVEGKDE